MGDNRQPGARRAGQHYTPAERAEAVRIVRASKGRTIRQIAADLGINDRTLNKWVVHARNAEIDPAGAMSDVARRRVRELEAENARLRRELEFQSKAQAFIRQISLRRSGSQ